MHLPELALMLSAVVTGSTKNTLLSDKVMSRLTGELVIEVNQLAIVDLFEEVLKFLGPTTALNFVNGSNTIVDVPRVLSDAHLRQLLQTLGLGDALEGIDERDQILECASQIFLRLLVLPTQTLQILVDLTCQSTCIEVLCRGEVGLDRTRE